MFYIKRLKAKRILAVSKYYSFNLLFKDNSLITFIGNILLKMSTVPVNYSEKIIKINQGIIVLNNSLGVTANYKYTSNKMLKILYILI